MKFSIKHYFLRSLQPLLAATALIAATPSADAAAYIKFDGIDGECADKEHKDWIIIQSFGTGMGSEPSATGGPAAVKPLQFKVEVPTERSSPKLMEAVCRGKVFPSVIVELTRDAADGQQTYYRYELKNVLISSYSVSGAADAKPMEQLALNYTEIKVISVDADGSKGGNVEFEWKVEEGES
ncbi:Hcp family type VI secretion system effector [Luteolibacter marinus]|uniref:Hcp family type VI secretion system effector n=1 Tax=Luteolibacter marinus TaxID=2776705 RepID=UPI001865D54B|nr:type VI secretion system tube protein Hcp [Luteolibacter marinus]